MQNQKKTNNTGNTSKTKETRDNGGKCKNFRLLHVMK